MCVRVRDRNAGVRGVAVRFARVRGEGGEQPFDADVARHVVQCAQGEIVGHVAAPDVARARLGLGDGRAGGRVVLRRGAPLLERALDDLVDERAR